MGRTYHFECPRCLYRARVAGGADAGLYCEIKTIVCLDCRQLYDVFTRVRQHGDPGSNAQLRPRMQPAGPVIPPLVINDNPLRVFKPGHRTKDKPSPWRWTKVKPCCPRAAYHRIEEWHDPGHCPRCGTFLEKNRFPYRLWD
jgi:hypothetical protein